MKKLFSSLSLFISCLFTSAQGFDCQFVPALQVGSTSIKYTSGALQDYKYGANLALMEYDHAGRRWYINTGLSDTYYRLTSLNRRQKMIRDSASYAKNNGQIFGMRIGRLFGKNEMRRVGFSINGSFSEVNAIKSYDINKAVTFGTFGGGFVFYQKIGKKLNVLLKGGYEVLKGKKYVVSGRQIYFEPVFAYEIYQRFGVCVSPSFYFKKFDFTNTNISGALPLTGTKANQFVLKVGIAKFLR